MRLWSLISVLVFGAACTVRVPQPTGITVSFKATARAEARVLPPPPPPPPPPPAVEMQGAPVVEFFGIPLEGVGDVVFVLDCSGSMDNLAQGRMAQIEIVDQANAGAPTLGPDPNYSNTPPQDASAPPPPPDSTMPPPPGDPSAAGTAVTATPALPRKTKLEIAKVELIDALERLPAGTQMNLVFFNSGLAGFAPHPIALDETSRASAIAFVREQEPTGSTALVPAMRTAFLMNAKRVVLLSDGLGNVGGNAQTLLRDARQAMRGGVRIDTIGLGADHDTSLLRSLASESGGLYQPL